ncbi:MAG: ABC transporter [Nitrospirales bacterium]|nr:MAG: ABC transporter [Nitrospirales bacterium]
MSDVLQIFDPSYVLRNALYGGILCGIALPIVGGLMYVRRMVFLGVTLPTISAAGIAMAIFWHATFHPDTQHSDFGLALLGSTILTTGTLSLLAVLERNGRGVVEGRIGVLYVLAGALTILLLASDRIPEAGALNALKGQIIAISDADLQLLVVCFTAMAVLLWSFRKELLLVSVDRDLAISLGKQVWVWDMLLYGIVGVTISLGVLVVGPLVTFGFLLLPPMIAMHVNLGIWLAPVVAAAIGMMMAFGGFLVSYQLDWPTGPTNVVIGCVLLGFMSVGQWCLKKYRTPKVISSH